MAPVLIVEQMSRVEGRLTVANTYTVPLSAVAYIRSKASGGRTKVALTNGEIIEADAVDLVEHLPASGTELVALNGWSSEDGTSGILETPIAGWRLETPIGSREVLEGWTDATPVTPMKCGWTPTAVLDKRTGKVTGPEFVYDSVADYADALRGEAQKMVRDRVKE